MPSGFVDPWAGKVRYSYKLPGFEAEGILQSPEELFGPGGLAKLINAEQQQNQRDSSNRTAQETSSEQAGPLTQDQRAMAVGDPIPVVFCRRRTGGTGGVLVLPKATEAQFSSADGTSLTARYHCILSDGQVSSVQVRDVRKGNVREGSFSQNYDKRAGTWTPGNRLANLPGINASEYPLQCGIGGNYEGISTIEFSSTHPFGSARWKQTWSAFVRGGLNVTRIYDNTTGPSDSIVDLVYWALINSGRMTAAEINSAQMLKAATFVEVNQLFCNGNFENRSSLPDFLLGILPAFLLRETTIDGKFALAPIPPVNADGTLSTGPLAADWVLTEEAILPGSVEINPSTAATSLPLEIAVGWRQQTSDVHPPLDRDLIIGVSTDTLPTREEWDLRGFCTSEAHAALVGGWRHAARTIGAATARVTLLRGSHTGYLRQGQIVHLYLQVVTEIEQAGAISGYWFVDSVSLTPDGSEALQLSACPVDAAGRPLLTLRALEFQSNAPGVLLPYPEIGVNDAPGRSGDTSIPPSTTSGTPFTKGGGGITGPGGSNRFNRSTLPPAPPSSPPPEPPTDGNGPVIETEAPASNVVKAGKDPQPPNSTNKADKYTKGWGSIAVGDATNVPPKCVDGFDVSTMSAKGLASSLGAPAVVTLSDLVFPPVVKRLMTEAEVILVGGSMTFVDNGVTYSVAWYQLNYKRAVPIIDPITGDTTGYQVVPATNMLGDTNWVNPSGVTGSLEITYNALSCTDRSEKGADT